MNESALSVSADDFLWGSDVEKHIKKNKIKNWWHKERIVPLFMRIIA